MKKFYLSTALPYVNDDPHAGFALEIIQADVVARYHRLLGYDVFFLTGTDENSLKNVQAAREEGISVKKLVDRNTQKFYELKKVLNLSFNDFIRTTENRHIKGAQKLWKSCKKDIYKKKYQGLYCVGCETFYKEEELQNGLCPEHQTKPELIEEENYFFRLSKYQNKLKNIIESDEVKIIPQTRKNEVLSFINSDLEDICISRSAERAYGWGIDVPEDPSQKIWVWFDALSNYINALGYGEDSGRFQEWWEKNENKLHMIGKGILRFHAVYWPAFLLSAGLSLPKKIFVHGYCTINAQKISKSLGNVIGPKELTEKFGIDGTRYLLICSLPFGRDGDISLERFYEKYNADLANGIGNLVARALTLATKSTTNYPAIAGPRLGGGESNTNIRITNDFLKFKQKVEKVWQNYERAMKDLVFDEVTKGILNFVAFCDRYINETEPWKLLKNDLDQFQEVIYNLLEGLRQVAWLIMPFMPETSDKIFEQLGVLSQEKKKNLRETKEWGSVKFEKIEKGKILFPRLTISK